MASNKSIGNRIKKDKKKEAIDQAKLDKTLSKIRQKKTGFTNKLAVYLILLLTFSLVLGFYLALKSIENQYTGALICWSCVVAPLDACLGVVIARVVEKSRAENVGADGTGISFAAAQAANFRDKFINNVEETMNEASIDPSAMTEAVYPDEDSIDSEDPSINSPEI